MSKLTDLEKLIALNGDSEKYSEGLKILNSGSVASGNSPIVHLAIGCALIAVAIGFSPNLRGQLQTVVGQGQERDRFEELEGPPLPPPIERSSGSDSAPLPPEPLPNSGAIETYYGQGHGQSLTYIKPE